MGKNKSTLILKGVIIFILASLALWSFQDAVFTPLRDWLTQVLGGGREATWMILLVSCLLLVYIFKEKLPFSR